MMSSLSLSPIALLQAAGGLCLLLLASFLFLLINRRQLIPINWPIIGMLPTILANNDRLLDYVVSVFREHGCTFMFKGPWFAGLDFLITCDPANANHIFNTNFSNYPKGEDFLEICDVFGEGIFGADGDEWLFQRRISHALIASREFHSSMAKHTRRKVADGLLPLLHKVEQSDGTVDLNNVFLRFTFDVICHLVVGVDAAYLALDLPAVPVVKALEDIEQQLFFRHVVPKFWWKLLRKLRVGGEKKMEVAREVIDQFIARCIEEKRAKMVQKKNEIGSHEDMLTSFMENAEVCSRPHLDTFLRDMLFTFFAAGTDGTATAISWLFWNVSKNPDVEKRILEELSCIASSKLINKEDDTNMLVFDAEEVDKLVYLHATLCESLRLFPSIPFNHKKAVKADILPSGDEVRAGTNVIFASHSMGRMERIWGKDCMEFKPERWILADGKLKREPSYKFLAFHCGPRLCLGRDMAFVVLKVVAASLIYNFHIQLVEGHVVEPNIAILLQMKNGMMVKVQKRGTDQY